MTDTVAAAAAAPKGNEPWRHHYIPCFYLKNWVNQDGKVTEMRKFPQRLSILRKAPKATGFKPHLYRIEGVPEEQAQQFETAFLKMADNHADLGLQTLLHGKAEDMDAKRRSGWSRFMTSLLFRNPEAVEQVKNHNLAMWNEGVKYLEEQWKAGRKEGDFETFEKYFQKNYAALPHVENAKFMRDIIDGGRVAPDLFKMDWSVIDLKNSAYPLMTSDRPLLMPLALGDPNAHVIIPIAPRKIFLAARRRDLKDKVRSRKHLDVVKQINKAVVAGAREYVWGIDDKQAPFVAKHICTTPDRVLIDEKAKQDALAAARAELRQLGVQN